MLLKQKQAFVGRLLFRKGLAASRGWGRSRSTPVETWVCDRWVWFGAALASLLFHLVTGALTRSSALWHFGSLSSIERDARDAQSRDQHSEDIRLDERRHGSAPMRVRIVRVLPPEVPVRSAHPRSEAVRTSSSTKSVLGAQTQHPTWSGVKAWPEAADQAPVPIGETGLSSAGDPSRGDRGDAGLDSPVQRSASRTEHCQNLVTGGDFDAFGLLPRRYRVTVRSPVQVASLPEIVSFSVHSAPPAPYVDAVLRSVFESCIVSARVIGHEAEQEPLLVKTLDVEFRSSK